MSDKPTYKELEKMVNEIENEANERKRAEKSLSREKHFSESIIDSLPGVFYFFDDEGKFIRWNKNLEEIWLSGNFRGTHLAEKLGKEFIPLYIKKYALEQMINI